MLKGKVLRDLSFFFVYNLPMAKPLSPLEFKQRLKRKIMDLLAMRDHSEKEIRTKLTQSARRWALINEEERPQLLEEGLAQAIAMAKESNWMGEPTKLTEAFSQSLHRKNKGIMYINHYLKEKGLPTIEADRDLELEKALALVKNKYPTTEKFSREDKARVARFLASRGFDSDTVRKVIYEKL